MDVCGRFLAVDQSDDVWMMQAFEDVDLGIEIFLELLVELVEMNRLDRYEGSVLLE